LCLSLSWVLSFCKVWQSFIIITFWTSILLVPQFYPIWFASKFLKKLVMGQSMCLPNQMEFLPMRSFSMLWGS
jgi:hypothetical protein